MPKRRGGNEEMKQQALSKLYQTLGNQRKNQILKRVKLSPR